MTQKVRTNPIQPKQPGSQPGNDWGRDQEARDEQARDRKVEPNQHPAGPPGDGPMQDDEIGKTRGAGHEATPRF